ncbi:hypothetical protein BLNAU_5446 [Blattamonas nauphoetae]|uniref:Uncharacterized protein n=1 Tax=Blattamonas nauphoetae TaxID=2049346 RepID=A0ABQ9Y7K9_9EUKA|nr:hypothetical protein BLNAU_5446 [Blattamonas nauphoetae]
MSPSASSSIHFLQQFRHNTTKAPNSNTKQKAETILGGLPIKPWVLTDKEQIARERSCGEYRSARTETSDGAPQASPPNVQTPSHRLPHSNTVPLLKAPFGCHKNRRCQSVACEEGGNRNDASSESLFRIDASGRDRRSCVGQTLEEREVQTYQNGMAKKVGEEDDDVDNLIEFLALTGDRSEEDALLTVLKDKTGQHVLAKVGSGKSEDIMQSIFRPREHTSLEKEDKHKGRSNASLKNSGNMIDFQDSANNTIQQSPFLPINVEDAPFIQTNTATAKSSDISAVGEKSTTDHALQGSQLAFGDHDDDHAVQCVDECGCVVRESTPSGRTPFTFAMVTAKLVVIATNVTAE